MHKTTEEIGRDARKLALRSLDREIADLEAEAGALEAEARRQHDKKERAERHFGDVNAQRARLAIRINGLQRQREQFKNWDPSQA